MKERDPEQRQGLFSRISLFFKAWQQLPAMSPEEYKRLKDIRRESRISIKNLAATFEDRLEQAKSHNEELSLIAQHRQALLDRWLEEFEGYPKGMQEYFLLDYQKKGETLQTRFEESGKERHRRESQIYLRVANMCRRALEDKNQDQTPR